jgi:hypothetical protein
MTMPRAPVERATNRAASRLIPDLSCKRCSPHPPFARLIGLRGSRG